MTRMNVIMASLLLIATSLSGCTTEELVDDILGCMDENAANYEENATSELVGDCIYMATAEAFMEAMTDLGSIEDMLEESPKAGYSQSISSSGWNQELGMQINADIEDIIMADLNTDSVYVHNSISIAGFLQMEYTHVQVGEVVNVHLLLGGMLQEEATIGSYQTRDATPNVLEVIAEQAGLFTGEDDDGEDDDGPVVSDGIPEDAVITITMSDDMESQTMTMEYTEDGAEITTTIHLDQNQDLVSMSVESDNGSETSSLTYEVMWGDAIVIEVDETLPRTSIPVWLDSEIFDDDDDHDDHGDDDDHDDHGDDDDHQDHHDNGNHISWNSYHDGYCEWEGYSDATDAGEDSRWWCKVSQDDEDWENWWYYCEYHDSDWHCTDDFGQSEEFEHSADGDVWSGSDDDGDGSPTPEEAMESVDANDDGYMSFQEFQDSWDSNATNPELDYDEVSILFDDCDYDGSDLIDIDEMQCFIDGIVDMLSDDDDSDDDDSDDGDHHETEEDAGHHHHGDGDYHHDHDDGADHTHDDADRHHDHDDDDSDDDGDGMERNDATGFVAENQTLNAPITDFEVHFLSDCEEFYDEDQDQMVQPDLSICTNEFSIPLTGGEAEGVTITYTDHDGDGLVSPGDEVSVEWSDYDGEEIDKMEFYDTWASMYSSESSATPPVLPGFGAVLGALALIGASMASRRD